MLRATLMSALLVLVYHATARAADIIIHTENYPPYNYLDESGSVVGDATDLVRKIMQESGLSYQIKLMPWGRAVRNTTAAENALIYSIARVPRRETSFLWLVPLAKDTYHLFGRTDDTRPVSRDLIRQRKFRIVCIYADISCALLRQFGVPEESIHEGVDINRPESLRLVEQGRVDFYVAGAVNYQDNVRELGFPETMFEPKLSLDTGLTLYLAGGSKLRPDLADAIESAVKRLKARGDYQLLFQ